MGGHGFVLELLGSLQQFDQLVVLSRRAAEETGMGSDAGYHVLGDRRRLVVNRAVVSSV